MARATFPETDKPYAMLSNFSSGIDRGDVELLEDAGIPVLEGTLTGLAAFRHLFAYRDHRALPPLSGSSPASDEVRGRWRERLSSGEPFGEVEGLALLSDWGVPVVAARVVESVEEALAAAEGIWPVALKTAAPGVHHKSDVDGVRLDLLTPDQLRGELRGRLEPARPARHGRGDGAPGRRDPPRHRARRAVRPAGAGCGRRRAGRGAARPAARRCRRSTRRGRGG